MNREGESWSERMCVWLHNNNNNNNNNNNKSCNRQFTFMFTLIISHSCNYNTKTLNLILYKFLNFFLLMFALEFNVLVSDI